MARLFLLEVIMIVGIVGSREYKNEKRVRAVIGKYIEKYGVNLIIVSGGCPDGADALAKKLALEMSVEYKEFPPAHFGHNAYCVLPAEHYNRRYYVENYFKRNTQIAEYCEHLIAFRIENVKASGTMDTVRKARSLKRQVLVLEDKA